MGTKKKRKSVAPTEEQPSKRSNSQQGRRSSAAGASSGGSSALQWGPNGVTATLLASQALVFTGRAQLTVRSGEVAVFGSVVTASSGPVELAADERCGGALLLEPGLSHGAVPLAASGPATVLTISRPAPGSSGGGGATVASLHGADGQAAQQQQQHQQQQQSEGTQRQQALGFDVRLVSDPAAPATPPPLPPLWHQAAAEVDATIAHMEQQQQQQQAGTVQAPPVIVVCGAKKVGKSTFARLLVNALLARHPCVAYLDTDCGQPEFTAAGLVSLTLVCSPVLGPPHLHPRRPAAAFFVGDTSPANDPVRYLQYVRELYRWYCRHGAAAAAAAQGKQQQHAADGAGGAASLPPLVVNTHGWVKGTGFDVLVEMLQGLPVSHLVLVAAANPKKNLPPGTFWMPDPAASGGGGGGSSLTSPQHAAQQAQHAQQGQVLEWLLPGLGEEGAGAAPQPTVSDTSARSVATYATGGGGGGAPEQPGGGGGKGRVHAVELRALQWEALAQQCVDACGLATASRQGKAAAAAGEDVGDLLAAAVPFEIDADDVELLHSAVPPNQLYYALNGAVVGLCVRPPAHQQQLQQLQSGEAAAAGQAEASTELLMCLGLGIVRAVDARRRRLWVLTAVPQAELEAVEVLQVGRLELPGSLLQTGAHMSPYLALHSLSSAGTGAGAIKSRNNLLRQSQM